MNIVPIRQRTLEHVLLDIGEAERRWRNAWHSDRECELLDVVDALRDEARQMVEAATGVSWNHLQASL